MSAKVNWLTSDRYIEPIGPPDSDGVINIDIQVDIYSDGKEDWLASTDLNKMKFPVQAVGGQTVSAGQLGTTYLFINSWKIKPYEGAHTFNLSGNAYTNDGLPLVVETYATDLNVRVNIQTTLTPPGIGLTAQEHYWLLRANRVLGNRQAIDADGYMYIYADDGVTPLGRHLVTDADGNPPGRGKGVPVERGAYEEL